MTIVLFLNWHSTYASPTACALAAAPDPVPPPPPPSPPETPASTTPQSSTLSSTQCREPRGLADNVSQTLSSSSPSNTSSLDRPR
ncbi:hypothetical protein K402DRAFT_393347 [Aulographum hederae CBS 113979]|uniref:Uncharacterized protein n=1 Tax=Aulographum hederae CBS 113979 TaxID=1176131 RepID=A0A6G1H0Y6_9PEZI|nr:hypothetical protein K402DRAFT_393347 [Aulographum hederae CBS 113979]